MPILNTPLILAIDDEIDFLEIIRAKLEPQGFRVITATDGNEIMTKVKNEKPAVILMDIEMPNKDGVAIAAELAADPNTKNIPIIFVTNLDNEIADALAKKVSLHIDAKSFFRKDWDYNFLIKKIQGRVAT